MKAWGHSPHDFRRWFYTTLLDIGCPTAYAKLLIGHKLAKEERPYVLKYSSEKSRPWLLKVEALLCGAAVS